MDTKQTYEQLLEHLCEDFDTCTCEELKKNLENSPDLSFLVDSMKKTIELYRKMHSSSKLPEECKKRLLERLQNRQR